MSLSTAQLAALATDIAANTNTVFFNITNSTVAIKDLPHSVDAAYVVAAWYNGFPAVDFFGNFSTVNVNDVKNAITFKNFTPADSVPASGGTTQITNDILNHKARTLLCQSFQINLNNLLTASTVIDATKASVVASWKDVTNTNMPSGTSGAFLKGGWTAIQPILCRKGTNAEKLFADLTGGNGSSNTTAASFGPFEGQISASDVEKAWGISG